MDAVNNGTIDAMIDSHGIVNGVYSDSSYTTPATLPKAVSYTVTYADGTEIQDKHLLAKKNGNTPTTETYKVRIEYRNDDEIDPDDLDNNNDQTYYFKFSVNYAQADNTAVDSHPSAIHYGNRQVEGQITPGDVIKIGETEDFYVISSDATKTVLLAKYNLMVGNKFEDYSVVGTIDPATTQGYGLQSVDATGYISNSSSWKGTVAFSSTSYWNPDGNGLISLYNQNGASYIGSPYPKVYNDTYTTAPDFKNDGFNTTGYSIAYYVEQYKTKLIEMGAPSTITGRLLSYEEADGAQSIEDNGTSIILDGRKSYWLGSADSNYEVWYVFSINSYFSHSGYNYVNYCGVRPVIEIPTSEIR